MSDPEVGEALRWFREGNAERAREELESLIVRRPDAAQAHNALGSVLAASGHTEQAIGSFERALSLRHEYPEAACNLGQALLEHGEIHAALAALSKAGPANQAPVQTHTAMGRAWSYLGEHDRAAECFGRARSHPSAHAGIRSQCCYAALLNPRYDARAVVALHRAFAAESPASTNSVTAVATEPPIIAYVSADFREHSVASFFEAVLHAHDRSDCRVYLYSDVIREDDVTARLKSSADRYESVARWSNRELARRIREDAVDVLVDLSGHMAGNRLPVFQARPAPIQLTYLGYPGTTGLSCFDGRLTDRWADPSDDPELAGPEPLVRIEGGCFAYTPPADAPSTERRPRAPSIVFGCMADALKLSDDVLTAWAEILRALPEARLLLKNRALAWSDVRARIEHVFASAAVPPSRLELLPLTATRGGHLAKYAEIDVALDTFPYSGAATTAEALYLGVPVVTLAGDHHRQLTSTSLLRAVGLDHLVTSSRDEYVRVAIQLANDLCPAGGGQGARGRQESSNLRSHLRERLRASPLFDGSRIARTIETLARQRVSAGA